MLTYRRHKEPYHLWGTRKYFQVLECVILVSRSGNPCIIQEQSVTNKTNAYERAIICTK